MLNDLHQASDTFICISESVVCFSPKDASLFMVHPPTLVQSFYYFLHLNPSSCSVTVVQFKIMLKHLYVYRYIQMK